MDDRLLDSYHNEHSEDTSARKKWLKYFTISCFLGATSYTLYPSSQRTYLKIGEELPKANSVFLQSYSQREMCGKGLSFWQNTKKTDQYWNGIAVGDKFTDNEFPASKESLYDEGYVDNDFYNDGLYENYQVKTWKRPSELIRSSSNFSAIVSLQASLEVCSGFGNTCEEYRGRQSQTRDGKTCVPWSDYPDYMQMFGDMNKGLESNYCRNPTWDQTIWCFTDSRSYETGYCDPIQGGAQPDPTPPSVEPETPSDQNTCEEENCSDYRGKLAISQNGLICDQWNQASLTQYPNGGLAGNYCRNPDNDKQLWCLISQASKGYEYCDEPQFQPTPEHEALENLEQCDKDKNCSDYRGTQSKSKKGNSCVSWESKNFQMPNAGLESNYCRNPDGDQDIWCFTRPDSLHYEYCEPKMNSTPSTNFVEASGTPSLWGSGGILPAGVRQGRLGSCWFLAVGAALAEHPDRIRKLFVNTEYPENGAFRINYFAIGRPISIVVDDQLPMNPRNEQEPVNTNVSIKGAWWMPILEKSYAKFSVFHANINGGTPLQSIRDLTNMPAFSYRSGSQSVDELFRQIHEADQKKWIVIGACNRDMEGLSSGHAYTILGALKLRDNNGREWNLLKMRNPWGSEGYNGPWSDKDHARWTDSMKAEVGHTQADDGLFMLPVELFKQAFAEYYIGMYQDWKVSTWSNTNNAESHKKTFSSNVNQDAYLTLTWMPLRRYPVAGCQGQNDNETQSYNIFMTNLSTRKQYQQPKQGSLGYANFKFPGGLKANEKWEVNIHDFKFNYASQQDFTVNLYADSNEVSFQ